MVEKGFERKPSVVETFKSLDLEPEPEPAYIARERKPDYIPIDRELKI